MSLEHAAFVSLDDPRLRFDVQFNPATLKRSWKPTWVPERVLGRSTGNLEYTRTPPRTLSMALTFDTTTEAPLCSVRSRYLRPFEAFVRAEFALHEGETSKVRPHRLLFAWADQAFKGVVTSMDTTTLMFSREGFPIRAQVDLLLTEFDPLRRRALDESAREQASTPWASPAGRVGRTAGGTLTQVARQLRTTERQLLADNHIADPMHIPAGTTLVVR